MATRCHCDLIVPVVLRGGRRQSALYWGIECKKGKKEGSKARKKERQVEDVKQKKGWMEGGCVGIYFYSEEISFTYSGMYALPVASLKQETPGSGEGS